MSDDKIKFRDIKFKDIDFQDVTHQEVKHQIIKQLTDEERATAGRSFMGVHDSDAKSVPNAKLKSVKNK